jgi:hypothetical protein
MRSNRAIQTILLALILVMVAAIAFKRSPATPGGQIGSSAAAAGDIPVPERSKLSRVYRDYFNEDPEIIAKAELLSIDVVAVSMEPPLAHVRLAIEFKWTGPNPAYPVGPLKNAPGRRGDRLKYYEVFVYRYWGEQGWDIEGRRKREEYR